MLSKSTDNYVIDLLELQFSVALLKYLFASVAIKRAVRGTCSGEIVTNFNELPNRFRPKAMMYLKSKVVLDRLHTMFRQSKLLLNL
jgi:hypothetical protein